MRAYLLSAHGFSSVARKIFWLGFKGCFAASGTGKFGIINTKNELPSVSGQFEGQCKVIFEVQQKLGEQWPKAQKNIKNRMALSEENTPSRSDQSGPETKWDTLAWLQEGGSHQIFPEYCWTCGAKSDVQNWSSITGNLWRKLLLPKEGQPVMKYFSHIHTFSILHYECFTLYSTRTWKVNVLLFVICLSRLCLSCVWRSDQTLTNVWAAMFPSTYFNANFGKLHKNGMLNGNTKILKKQTNKKNVCTQLRWTILYQIRRHVFPSCFMHIYQINQCAKKKKKKTLTRICLHSGCDW